MKENMYYGASSFVFQKAEELRNRMTPAEEVLWKAIHINEWKLKFRRQHPVANWVVDFYCHSIKLVVELDGGIHDVKDVKRNDEERESYLKRMGLTVLRFKNEEVLANKKSVLEKISETIVKLQSPLLGDGGKKLFIIKIGGDIIDDEAKLSSFLKSFAAIEGKKILVHGGGKIATKIGDKLGIESKYVDGRRITDAATLDLVTMVYAGLINKKIVAQLQSYNCNAIGITGADGNLIPATKRKVQNTPSEDGGIDFGFVGDIDTENMLGLFWDELLQLGLTPVAAPITHDGKGQLLNTNADTIAQEVAKVMCGLYEVSLVYSFDKMGVLSNVNDESTVINKLNKNYYDELKNNGKIFAGMLPKLDNAFTALSSGVKKVIIGNAEQLKELIAGTSGTTITNE